MLEFLTTNILDQNLIDIGPNSKVAINQIYLQTGIDLETEYTVEEKEAIAASDIFYERLYELGYRTAREAIPVLEEGEIPLEHIDNLLRVKKSALIPEILSAIKIGYVETGIVSQVHMEWIEEEEKQWIRLKNLSTDYSNKLN